MNAGWKAGPIVAGVALFSLACGGPGLVAERGLDSSVVTTGLESPFEIAWGPDGQIWVTERTAGRVTRVSPSDGARSVALKIDDVLVTEGAQDGLLGMALHPQLMKGDGSDHVVVAYTYDAAPGPEVLDRRVKIVRYTYDPRRETLESPVVLLSGLPGSEEHNAGRLSFGPDSRLYYTIGDQGNNQSANRCRRILAQDLPSAEQIAGQDWTAYQGKVLRLGLDGSIPDDNPVLGGVRSHVYSYGHRNPQGLAFGLDGAVYVSEHGTRTDDEIDLLEPGMNYGWPGVSGFRDDQVYEYAQWNASVDPPCEELPYSEEEIPPSVPTEEESAFVHPDYREPIMTFYTVPDGHDFRDPACAASGLDHLCWPTIAPSGMIMHRKYAGEPAAVRSALWVTSLKHGALYRIPLGADGRPVSRDAEVLFRTTNRYRDLAAGPSGLVYVITDSRGNVMGPGGPTRDLENPGSILAFSPRD